MIRLEIQALTAQEVLDDIKALFAQGIGDGQIAPSADAMNAAIDAFNNAAPMDGPVDDAVDAEIVEPARKPRATRRKPETIEAEVVKEPEVAETADEGEPDAPSSETSSDQAPSGESETTASADEVADGRTLAEAKLDGDIRVKLIRQYLNVFCKENATEEFQRILTRYGVKKLGDVPVAKLADLDGYVDELIAQAEAKAA